MRYRYYYYVFGEYLEGYRCGDKFYFDKRGNIYSYKSAMNEDRCWKDRKKATEFLTRMKAEHAASLKRFNSVTPCKFELERVPY